MTLPAEIEARVRALMDGRRGGELVIHADGRVSLDGGKEG